MRWLQMWVIICISIFGIGGSAWVNAGNWDEHLGVQTYLNELALNSGVSWLDNGLATFALGYLQHQVYDLIVNERPVHLNKLIRQMQKSKDDPVNYLESEEATLIMCLTGGSIALYKTLHMSAEEEVSRLGKRLMGLLGSLAPDLLEGLRLGLMGSERAARAWVGGDACSFHIVPPEWWRYPVDTFYELQPDLQRRLLLQSLLVMW